MEIQNCVKSVKEQSMSKNKEKKNRTELIVMDDRSSFVIEDVGFLHPQSALLEHVEFRSAILTSTEKKRTEKTQLALFQPSVLRLKKLHVSGFGFIPRILVHQYFTLHHLPSPGLPSSSFKDFLYETSCSSLSV